MCFPVYFASTFLKNTPGLVFLYHYVTKYWHFAGIKFHKNDLSCIVELRFHTNRNPVKKKSF